MQSSAELVRPLLFGWHLNTCSQQGDFVCPPDRMIGGLLCLACLSVIVCMCLCVCPKTLTLVITFTILKIATWNLAFWVVKCLGHPSKSNIWLQSGTVWGIFVSQTQLLFSIWMDFVYNFKNNVWYLTNKCIYNSDR